MYIYTYIDDFYSVLFFFRFRSSFNASISEHVEAFVTTALFAHFLKVTERFFFFVFFLYLVRMIKYCSSLNPRSKSTHLQHECFLYPSQWCLVYGVAFLFPLLWVCRCCRVAATVRQRISVAANKVFLGVWVERLSRHRFADDSVVSFQNCYRMPIIKVPS